MSSCWNCLLTAGLIISLLVFWLVRILLRSLKSECAVVGLLRRLSMMWRSLWL